MEKRKRVLFVSFDIQEKLRYKTHFFVVHFTHRFILESVLLVCANEPPAAIGARCCHYAQRCTVTWSRSGLDGLVEEVSTCIYLNKVNGTYMYRLHVSFLLSSHAPIDTVCNFNISAFQKLTDKGKGRYGSIFPYCMSEYAYTELSSKFCIMHFDFNHSVDDQVNLF